MLTKFGLADTYKGQEEPTGEDYNVEEVEDGPRPFTALLDTGLKRTSTGSKVFAALKVRPLAGVKWYMFHKPGFRSGCRGPLGEQLRLIRILGQQAGVAAAACRRC